ncbi:hypothetical protein E2P81_ATG04545 [Venturia nashicola]|uniref:Domain of unknown function at the cortex 1 domain-containing protein n=1 Tax=Venturia nashicola TaxID=86259 RepID=A0A4Z1NY92_9PEZI|nr:hypothetical protein E6O75_ATG04653 [Venturia nashicola]TLD34380.1 hypothetical protein E2P81_ATG04545 [Venturia nashicola]
MSYLNKVRNAVWGASNHNDIESLNHGKYMLKVTAGPAYHLSTQKPVVVNGDEALQFENDFMTASIKVRIRGYQGLPKHSPTHSAYFDHPDHIKDQYSVGFSFVPKRDIPAIDAVFGHDFDRPVRDRLPPGFTYAFAIVKEFIDPGIEADPYSDKPWLFAPALDCWFILHIGDILPKDFLRGGTKLPHVHEHEPLQEGGDASGLKYREDNNIPTEAHKRRKHFIPAVNRKSIVFEKNRLYQGDFFNPYIDFNNFRLKLPGFSIRVIKYIDDKTHNLRWVFKDMKTGDVYFVVNLTLLFGEELKEALLEEETETIVMK